MATDLNPLYVFIVSGKGIFPLDMLRYDTCFPMDTETANAIHDSIDDATRFTEDRAFRLTGRMRFGPTAARWESFGFKVEEVQLVRS